MAFLDVKGQLAKLLATENLHIEHSQNAQTASFNTATRVLTLPLLESDNEHVYNMFIGHEVGHALETPPDFADIIPKDVPFDFVNVIEDVRIEKHIQDKFPGLRKDFSKGYDALNDRDFFDISDKDLSKLSLIDRINLHFKLGARALMPFNEEEMVYVRAVDDADTFNKVVLTAKMIADFVKAKRSEDDGKEMQPNQSGNASGDSETEDQDTEPTRESRDEPEAEQQQENTEANTEKQDDEELKSQTQEAFDKALGKMTKYRSDAYTIYTEVPDDKYLDIIRPADSVCLAEICEIYSEDFPIAYAEYKEFLKSIKAEVNFMVQRFEMKKSAQAHARAQSHKTGVLDMERLPHYKLVDDIFKKQTLLPDGKNHGMVMMVDWSGSMDHIVFNTVKQIIVLTQFCRKVNIPFEVLTFNYINYKPAPLEADKQVSVHSLNVVQRLSSKQKRGALDTSMFLLFCDGRMHSRNSYRTLTHSNESTLGGTPLNSVMTLMPAYLRRFKRQTGAEKVSFVCVTDGESSPLFINDVNKDGDCYIRQTTWKEVFMRYGANTLHLPQYETHLHAGMLARWVEEVVPGVTCTNIFLATCKGACKYARSQSGGYDYDRHSEFESQFKKTQQAVLKTDKSWPTIALVNPNQFNNDLDEIPVEAGATKAQLRAGLKKYFKGKKTNKVFLSGLIDQLA